MSWYTPRHRQDPYTGNSLSYGPSIRYHFKRIDEQPVTKHPKQNSNRTGSQTRAQAAKAKPNPTRASAAVKRKAPTRPPKDRSPNSSQKTAKSISKVVPLSTASKASTSLNTSVKEQPSHSEITVNNFI